MNQLQRIMLRKKALDLLDSGYNKDFNCCKFSAHSTREHELKKAEICYEILKNGGAFLTEAIFKGNKGRADVIRIDDDGITIIEIVKSESLESIKNKMSKYPEGIKFEVISC